MRRSLCVFALLAAACDTDIPVEPPKPEPPIIERAAPQKPIRFRPELGVGVVRGIVAFEGETPKRGRIRMKQDCEQLQPENDPPLDERIIVDEHPDGSKTLRNVFVYVSAGLEGWTFDVPQETVRISMSRCRYDPHMIGIRVGQPVEFVAADTIVHNPHYLPVRTREIGVSQADFSKKIQFERPEVLANIKCDVHNWMRMYIGVMEHPFFAVTGPDGTFALPALPPGKYTLIALHETGVKRSMELAVEPSGVVGPAKAVFVIDRATIR